MDDQNEQSQGPTVKCPKCKEDIQLGAEKCKHCGADLRNWFIKHKVITGFIILLFFLIIMGVAGDKKEQPITKIPTTSSPDITQSNSTPNSNSAKKLIILDKNDPTIKQLGTLTADYVGKSFIINVNAETSDYYNYGFDDETKYYSLKIWDDSVSSDFDAIYAYVIKNDTNKQLVNALLDSSAQLEIHASIPTTKWQSGSNAFLQIDSWKLLP